MEGSVTFTHDKDYHDIVNNKESLRRAAEKLLYNIIDDITLGIIFDTHRKFKTRAFDLDGSVNHGTEEEEQEAVDLFDQHNLKKRECECPICDKTVAANRFAPHLATCMGKGRNRSSRRIANNNDTNRDRDSAYSTMASDNEDDADWNSEDKRRKKKQRNGNKKGKGTPKKSNHRDLDLIESMNVDIEGDDDGDLSVRDFLQDSMVSSSSPSKKKDKGKSKKNN